MSPQTAGRTLASWGKMARVRERWMERAVEAGGDLEAEQWRRIAVLVDLWRRYGRAMNLVGSTSDEALGAHIGDALEAIALAASALGTRSGSWLDVGTGGGFPGLVVGAVWDGPVCLVEPRAKRAAFLELGVGALGCDEVRVLRGRVDRSTWCQMAINGELSGAKGGFDVASARAVWKPDEWIDLATMLVKPGGFVVVHRDVGARSTKSAISAGCREARQGKSMVAERANDAISCVAQGSRVELWQSRARDRR